MLKVIRIVWGMLLGILILYATAFSMAYAKNKYPMYPASQQFELHGSVSFIDKTNRLISVDGKTYQVSIGAKIVNADKTERYSGLKLLNSGDEIYFNLERGTKHKKIPRIIRLWIIFR